jgi:hypothetical protein
MARAAVFRSPEHRLPLKVEVGTHLVGYGAGIYETFSGPLSAMITGHSIPRTILALVLNAYWTEHAVHAGARKAIHAGRELDAAHRARLEDTFHPESVEEADDPDESEQIANE